MREKRSAKTQDKTGVGRSLTKMPDSPGARAPGETQAYLAQKQQSSTESHYIHCFETQKTLDLVT
jgi:hypothetical protein